MSATGQDTATAATAIGGAPPRTSVAVCVLTYKRPQGLGRLLDTLAELDLDATIDARLVVVDNDAEGSGEATVAAHRHRLPFPVTYVREPARSISLARNRAVEVAGDAEFVVFVDDDEWPERDWLVNLVDSQRRTGADVVTAHVIPVFDSTPPDWVLAGRFFERPRHGHNERIRYATTSNVLIRRSALALVEGPFDEAFGLSGGSDTHLFAQLREAGCSLVWCDTAPVREAIPDSRVSARWILRREYRRGQTLSLSLRARGASPQQMVRRVGNGMWNVAAGVVATVLGLRHGRVGVLRGLHRINFGAGMLTGLAGLRHLEYRKVHGG